MEHKEWLAQDKNSSNYCNRSNCRNRESEAHAPTPPVLTASSPLHLREQPWMRGHTEEGPSTSSASLNPVWSRSMPRRTTPPLQAPHGTAERHQSRRRKQR